MTAIESGARPVAIGIDHLRPVHFRPPWLDHRPNGNSVF
jgi:hypothetical protein